MHSDSGKSSELHRHSESRDVSYSAAGAIGGLPGETTVTASVLYLCDGGTDRLADGEVDVADARSVFDR